MKICSVEQCNKPHLALGYCSKHWTQIKRRGHISQINRLDPNTVIVDKDVVFIVLRDTLGNEKARTMIDIADLESVKLHKWYLTKNGYAMTRLSKQRQQFLHRFIINCPDGMIVDHIDGNPLNNRKDNLRICTPSDNQKNLKTRMKNVSGISGVSWDKRRSEWRARINVNGREIYLGGFESKNDAINARLDADKRYFGEFSRNKS